ncbi:MAG: M15 family metallopeptidase [Prevotella sp.]|nr:M15 family metallopeptidase [Prevotella sp.]
MVTMTSIRLSISWVMLMVALAAWSQPAGITLDTLRVKHIDGQGQTQVGLLICNKRISKDLQEIFSALYEARYPIERIRPISEYGDDDEQSMRANNTSCYCYRVVEGSKKLSNHARGLAIDINPLYNPCVRRKKDGTILIQPSTGKPYVNRNKKFAYKITKDDLCYRLFIRHGFKWGGDWRTVKDYQHFEKPDA